MFDRLPFDLKVTSLALCLERKKIIKGYKNKKIK